MTWTHEKIDLAHAYLDMGDPHGALDILTTLRRDINVNTSPTWEDCEVICEVDRLVASIKESMPEHGKHGSAAIAGTVGQSAPSGSVSDLHLELSGLVDQFHDARGQLAEAKRAVQFTYTVLRRSLIANQMEDLLKVDMTRLARFLK